MHIAKMQMVSEDGKIMSFGGGVENLTLIPQESDQEIDEFIKDINKPISMSLDVHKKRHGSEVERSMYYSKHKKKRIRKKYDLFRMLTGGKGINERNNKRRCKKS